MCVGLADNRVVKVLSDFKNEHTYDRGKKNVLLMNFVPLPFEVLQKVLEKMVGWRFWESSKS